MNFEWDEEKNLENQKKHGVSFELAKRIFEGPIMTRDDDRYHYDEERSVTIGAVGGHTVLLVAHTDRDDNRRIISARYATKNERRIYNEKIEQLATSQQFSGPPRGPKS